MEAEKWADSSFQKYEWVKIIDHSSVYGFVGYVNEFDFWASKYLVRITTRPDGKKATGLMWIPINKIISIEKERHQEDIKILIDLALDEKDEAAFKELTGGITE